MYIVQRSSKTDRKRSFAKRQSQYGVFSLGGHADSFIREGHGGGNNRSRREHPGVRLRVQPRLLRQHGPPPPGRGHRGRAGGGEEESIGGAASPQHRHPRHRAGRVRHSPRHCHHPPEPGRAHLPPLQQAFTSSSGRFFAWLQPSQPRQHQVLIQRSFGLTSQRFCSWNTAK
jgi:hypothetical protein